jgi:hypothetical protein
VDVGVAGSLIPAIKRALALKEAGSMVRCRIPERICSFAAGFMIEVRLGYRMFSVMKLVLISIAIVSGLLLSGCASAPDDPDQVKLGPGIREQQKEARKTEEFARSLPKPHE